MEENMDEINNANSKENIIKQAGGRIKVFLLPEVHRAVQGNGIDFSAMKEKQQLAMTAAEFTFQRMIEMLKIEMGMYGVQRLISRIDDYVEHLATNGEIVGILDCNEESESGGLTKEPKFSEMENAMLYA